MSKKPRSRRRPRRDPLHGSDLVLRFAKELMTGGRASQAEGVVRDAVERARRRLGHRVGATVLERALRTLEGRRSTWMVDVPLHRRQRRDADLAVRHLLQSARERAGGSMATRLADELVELCEGGPPPTVGGPGSRPDDAA